MTEGNGLTKLAQKLRDAKAAQEPITIDAALLSGCDLSPVENFDKMLRAGFRLPDDGSLKLDVSKAEIGAGTTSPLLVTSAAFDASLKFLGLLSSVIDLSLCFATRDGNGDPVADVQIEATIKKPDWKLSDYFTYMTGWPFSEIDLKSLRFVFSTVEGTYPTNDENGTPGDASVPVRLRDAVCALQAPDGRVDDRRLDRSRPCAGQGHDGVHGSDAGSLG